MSEANGKATQTLRRVRKTHSTRWTAMILFGIVVAIMAFIRGSDFYEQRPVRTEFLTVKAVETQILSLTGDNDDARRAREAFSQARKLFEDHLDWPENHPSIQSYLVSAVDAVDQAKRKESQP